jgi:hypothetical protein
MGKNISLQGRRKNNLKVLHQKAVSGLILRDRLAGNGVDRMKENRDKKYPR